MREQRLETIRKRLIGLREDLLAEVRSKNAEAASLRDEGVADVADLGLTDNLSELLHLLSDSKREEIMNIDEALERLRQGRYGQCLGCGEQIDIERLELRPNTRFCIDCKTRMEKAENLKAGPGKGTL
ncbi:MAG TPA: TraR/DksA family transcriptional regulator [Desulfuromonadales bacterium]|jgi:DnaK suppressor protein